MKKIVAFSFLTLILVIPPFLEVEVVWGEPSENTEFTLKSTVKFSNKGNKVWNFTQDETTIGLFMNNTWQTVSITNSTYPLEKAMKDEDENLIASLQFPHMTLLPGGNLSYTVTYQATRKPRSLPNLDSDKAETLEEIPIDLKEKYCKAEGAWLINNSSLQQLAQNIRGSETKVLSIVEMLVSWIWKNIKYESHEVPLYPNETYQLKKGDCDDQAILLITLCRILGIPSHLQLGCIYNHGMERQSYTSWNDSLTNVQKHIGWHGWAMVYIPPWNWLPVDLTYVSSGTSNPLNAIKTAAIVSAYVYVIQQENISRTDYIASTRQYRGFLTRNGFTIYVEDEMIPLSGSVLRLTFLALLRKFLPLFLVVAATGYTLIVIILVRKRRNSKL